MILVTGGVASGKTEYVKSLGYSEQDISPNISDDAPVLDDLQELIRLGADWADLLPVLLKKEVVICTQVGAGVVPVSPEERNFRENTGRLCIELAKSAEKVILLCCGIAQVIKE